MSKKKFSEALISSASNAAFCEMDDKIVLMNVNTGYYYGLDEVGKFIWNILQKPSTFEDIEAAVRNHYSVEGEQNSRNISDLLVSLEQAGLIQIKKTNKSF